MFTRMLMIFGVLVLVSACADKDESLVLDEQTTTQREGISEGPLAEIYDGEPLNGAAPGSQEDFVVNVGDRVFFATGRHDVSSDARSTLEKQANWLNQYQTLSITVEGHADERGTREYNLALGERRANSVKTFLVALGVDPRRIDTVTWGKERPAVVGSGESAWSQNRRGVSVLK